MDSMLCKLDYLTGNTLLECTEMTLGTMGTKVQMNYWDTQLGKISFHFSSTMAIHDELEITALWGH